MISGSLPALVTPMKDDAGQSVDFDTLARLIELHCSSGSFGVVPCGTTGEAPTLSHEEHCQIIRESVDAARGSGMKVIPGTGSNSTREAMLLTEYAAKSKADACLIVVPYYNRPTPEGIVAHFRQLNGIGIPIVVYNIPSRTGLNVEPQILLQIAAECPNVVGMKASSGNLDEITQTANLMRQENRRFSILSGDDSLTIPIMSVGGSGVVSVLANILPKTMSCLVEMYAKGSRNDDAAKFMQTIHPLCLALLRFGANPSPTKMLLNRIGIRVGGCRLPIVDVTESRRTDLFNIFDGVVEELSRQGFLADRIAI